jgi:hypothetical protein
MLLPVFKTKEKRGQGFAQVEVPNLGTGSSELGWVDINSSDLISRETFPTDSELFRTLGTPYLEDFAAEHTRVARFLVRQTQGPPTLLCYLVMMPLSSARLVTFSQSRGRFVPADSIDIPTRDIQSGLTSIETRELLGDGSDCIITKESFREQAKTSGTNLCVRRIVNGQFQILWKAPIEFQNLSQYGARTQILKPPDQNIGSPGTVTTGTVIFRANGSHQDAVWKGKVEFFVVGREKPVDSLSFEKVCPWDGHEFVPLR